MLTRRSMLIQLASLPLVRYLAACKKPARVWASGGTKAMTAKASYPNPFASGVPATAALLCEATQGPCWDGKAAVRQDISDGQPGLPTRLYFQIVDAARAPIANATLDIWHVAPNGEYSGDDAENMDVDYCTGGDAVAQKAMWFRGKQTTDANGLAYFDTCFPGWYASRAVHVHFAITNGSAQLISQLVFDDALDDEIIATQPIYKDRGERDTRNADDNVVGGATLANYTFATERMSDGALLAWKTIAVAEKPSCEIGMGGPGGPDGPGPGGPGGPPGFGPPPNGHGRPPGPPPGGHGHPPGPPPGNGHPAGSLPSGDGHPAAPPERERRD